RRRTRPSGEVRIQTLLDSRGLGTAGEAVMFHVDWLDQASDKLADAWVSADGAMRARITQSANEIDQRLGANPLQEGESRSSGRRILLVQPLVVIFRINTAAKTVTVVDVGIAARPRS